MLQDLYSTITKFLDPKDSASLLRTSKILNESKKRILTIEVQNWNFTDDNLAEMVKSYPNLKLLDLSECEYIIQHLTNISSYDCHHIIDNISNIISNYRI